MPLTLNMVKKALSSYPQSLTGKGWHADMIVEKIGKGCFNVDFRNAEFGDSINRTVTVCQKGNEFAITTNDAMALGNYDFSKAVSIPQTVNNFLKKNTHCHLFIDHRAPVIECEKKTIMKSPIENLDFHLRNHPFVIPSNLSLNN